MTLTPRAVLERQARSLAASIFHVWSAMHSQGDIYMACFRFLVCAERTEDGIELLAFDLSESSGVYVSPVDVARYRDYLTDDEFSQRIDRITPDLYDPAVYDPATYGPILFQSQGHVLAALYPEVAE